VKRPPSAEETTRSMGTLARRKFVAALPCAACGIVGYSQNAHLLGTEGTGRKKHHSTIGPLCAPHPRIGPFSEGCHNAYDEHRWLFDARFPDFNPEAVAAQIEADWQVSQGAKT
jgi:hypothetical protein